MAEVDVWPVVFIGWKSKAEHFHWAFKMGQLDVWTGKLHVRKGALFVAILEDGTLIASGQVANVTGNLHELALNHFAPELVNAPKIQGDSLARVLAVPKPFLKGPITAIIVFPQKKEGSLDQSWFDAVIAEVPKLLKPTSTRQILTPTEKKESAPAKESSKHGEVEKASVASDDERESLLKGWIPPVLQGLLADHVRADQWELLVAYAFRALGCQVKYQGKKAGAKAVPDCIARYTSPTGQLIELIIDAKAGHWNAAVDDIRAMRDYVEVATPYAYPLFVANSLTKDVQDKLRQHVLHGKVARAICGRDLALLIAQRLTDPNFNVEFELRRFFL